MRFPAGCAPGLRLTLLPSSSASSTCFHIRLRGLLLAASLSFEIEMVLIFRKIVAALTLRDVTKKSAGEQRTVGAPMYSYKQKIIL